MENCCTAGVRSCQFLAVLSYSVMCDFMRVLNTEYFVHHSKCSELISIDLTFDFDSLPSLITMRSIQNYSRRPLMGRFAAKQCLRRMASNNDEPKLTKSDEVKIHSVRHCAVEKTPVTAQLWAQRSRGRQSIDQHPNSYVSRVPLEPHDGVPAFLMDKTSKESRLTIKYKFSNDGR